MRMQPAHANRRPPRAPVNVTVDRELLAEARALGIPISGTLEEALQARVLAVRQARWLEENREAIAEYNERVKREGTFGSQFGNI